MRHPWRSLGGILLAVGTVACVFPLLPWAKVFFDAATWRGYHLLPVLVPFLLTAAGVLLPVRPRSAPRNLWHPTALSLGVILLLQPVLQLMVLGLFAVYPDRNGFEVVLPGPIADASTFHWLWIVITVVLLPAIAEEWFFRARLLPWIEARLGTFSAVTLSSCWFAAVHGQLYRVEIALIIGLALGLLYVRQRSLYACVAGHALHNAIHLLQFEAGIISPVTVLVLAAGGIWLIGFAAGHRTDMRRRVRTYLAVTLIPAMALPGAIPLHTWLLDRIWCAAAMRIVRCRPVSDNWLVHRFVHLDRSGLLGGRRRELLGRALTAEVPLPSQRRDPVLRRAWLLAIVDPPSLVRWTRADNVTEGEGAPIDARAEEALYVLHGHPDPPLAFRRTILLLGRHHPRTLVRVADYADPPLFDAEAYPLHRYGRDLIGVFEGLSARLRGRFAHILREAYSRRAAVRLYMRIDPGLVTPGDRYFLRLSYSEEYAEALEDLPSARAAAWRGAVRGDGGK